MGLRLLPFLQHSQRLGSLVNVIFAMFVLMIRFLVVMSLVLFGFIVGMHGLVHGAADPVNGYETNGQTLLTLFAAALGDFSMDFGERTTDPFFSTNARLMMGVFVATITLLCLNLLIAFLTDAYTQVSEDKDKAFAWTRAAAVVETGERVRQGILPPPLNILQMHASMVGVCTGRSHSGASASDCSSSRC